MRALVHIGMPKTGTTTIQSWLKLNRERLDARGVVYRRVKMPEVNQYISHVELRIVQMQTLGKIVPSQQVRRTYGIDSKADQARVARQFSRRVEKIVAGSPADSLMVFSSEQVGTMGSTAQEAAALDHWMRERFSEVRYLVYLRSQETWLPSNYVQSLRRGEHKTLEAYFAKGLELDYHAVVKAWAEGTDRERLSVALLEPDFLEGGDLLEDFAARIGVEASAMQTPKISNESLSAAAAEVLRRLNEAAPLVVEGRRNPAVQRARKLLTEHGRVMPPIALPPALVDRIRAANAETNEALRADWFAERDTLFPPRPGRAGTTEADPADISALAAMLSERLGPQIDAYLAAQAAEGT